MPRETITSLQNVRVKAAAHLRERRQRTRQGRMLIDGARELLRAWQAGVEIDEVFVCESLSHGDDCRQLLRLLDDRLSDPHTWRLDVTPALMEKLAFGERAEGVIGVARARRHALADLKLPERPLVAVVEGIEKPGNLGAILRTADAAGLSALVSIGGTDLANPNVIRASLGTVFTVPVAEATVEETIAWLRERRLAIFAARLDATTPYTAVNLAQPAAILLGSEAAGLSPAWSAAGATPIKLPMHGAADSLNVSATAAVLFYEALRQRTLGERGGP